VIASLPGPTQVKDVMLGNQGVIANMKAGTCVIDTSTSAVDLVKQLFSEGLAKHVDFLEAPVTNAVDMAALGRLSIFVGGSEKCFQQHKPIFDVLGEKIFYVGVPGNGATVTAATMGEALMLGAKAGIPLDIVSEAIQSSAGNSWVAKHDIPSIFAGHYDPSFSLALCCKDLGLINDIARQQGYELTMGALAQSVFEQARAQYGDSAAELHVVRLIEEKAGLLLRPPHGVAWDASQSFTHTS
jgi:3-hydroxyisobutyrate dehydrogenase-like beta-hydroxyacid dehydrogenase